MREADDVVVGQVDADHPLGEPLLERLLDHQPAAVEVRLAAVDELAQRECSAARRASRAARAAVRRQPAVVELDLPDSLAAHPALLLQHRAAPSASRAASSSRNSAAER